MSRILAVDAGGTSTRCVLVDRDGRCRGYGRAGSGNPISAGPETAVESVVDSARQALAMAGEPAGSVDSVLVAMAGGRSIDGTGLLAGRLAAYGVEGPVVLSADLLAMFSSGTHLTSGYALVAGTGAAAIRVEDGREAATADGLGWLLGDDGSGFWIGLRVVRAVLAELDSRGPATAMTPLLLRRVEIAGDGSGESPLVGGRSPVVQELLGTLYGRRPVSMAEFAEVAFEAGEDPIAREILDEAAESLRRTLRAVASPAVTGPVVVGGGVMRRAGFAERVAGVGDESPAVVTDGVAGAAVLALRRAGIEVDADVFATVTTTLDTLR